MGSRWRDFVEALLPWYSPGVERLRDAHTEALRKRTTSTRQRAERIIADYERADAASRVHGRRLIDELRRDNQ